MSNKKTVTAAQRECIRSLRKELASNGYFILPVARRFRKHKSDFVAVPKKNPREMVLVQPGGKGNIITHPFASFRLDSPARIAVQRVQRYCKTPIRSGFQLLSTRKSLRPEHLLTEQGHKDLKILLGIDLYEKTRSD